MIPPELVTARLISLRLPFNGLTFFSGWVSNSEETPLGDEFKPANLPSFNPIASPF
jgi:hypothetical protein